MTRRLLVEYPVGGDRRPLVVADKPLAVGGEAAVHEVLSSARPGEAVAKLYHRDAPEQAETSRRQQSTVRTLVELKPAARPEAPGHVTYVWPRFLVYRPDGLFAGFVMSRVHDLRPLDEFLLVNKHDPNRPRGLDPRLSRALGLGGNLAAAVAGLHGRGLERLDLSGANALVGARLLVTLIDTDTYRVPGAAAADDPPAAVTPDLAAPEVLRDPEARPGRSQDEWALGVLLFNLLVGVHPFHGVRVGPGRGPRIDELVTAGLWPYDPGAVCRVRPPRHAAPPEVLTPELWGLFRRCFVGGQREPGVRPGARAWAAALGRAAAAEMWGCRECGREFYAELPGCPWCRPTGRPHAGV
jgi:DNA-binding helix-hairpin-helix protein with protein kinase domain